MSLPAKMNDQSPSSNKRKTIGLLISGFNSQVSMLEWQGVMDGAKDADLNLITYDGEVINDQQSFKYQSNRVLGSKRGQSG